MNRLRNWLLADIFRIVVLTSIAIGSVFGFAIVDGPDCIDGALVLAGVVRYPAQTVMGVYFMNMWTALHQIVAVPLLLGLPSETVIRLVFVLLGICACTAVLSISVALTRNLAVAFAVTVLVLQYAAPVRFTDYGVVFWVAIYGTWSAVLLYLAFGLLGNRRLFASGCIALFSIAVHPVVGLWTAAVTCSAVAFASREEPAAAKEFWRGAALGAGLAALSFLVYWLMRVPALPGSDPELFDIYMRLWDSHRNNPYSPYPFVYATSTLCLLASFFGGRSRPSSLGERAMLFALAIAVIASTGLYEIGHRFREFLPEIVNRAMPTRFPGLYLPLLLPLVAGTALRRGWSTLAIPAVVGALTQWSLLAGSIAAALACWALARTNPRLDAWLRPSSLRLRAAAGFATTLIGAVFVVTMLHMQLGPRWRALGEATGRPALLLAIEGRLSRPWNEILDLAAPAESMPFTLVGARTRSLLAQAHSQGLVATTDSLTVDVHRHMHLPVLLETQSFDFLPYLPEAVRPIAQIVEEVYGIDFRSPPEALRFQGSLGELAGKAHWPRLSEADWIRLAHRFCIGGVVAPARWPLQLATTLELGAVRYYRVPTELPAECRARRS